jgi:hypothetical protein
VEVDVTATAFLVDVIVETVTVGRVVATVLVDVDVTIEVVVDGAKVTVGRTVGAGNLVEQNV